VAVSPVVASLVTSVAMSAMTVAVSPVVASLVTSVAMSAMTVAVTAPSAMCTALVTPTKVA
jgi:hypothetical protein